MGGFTCPRCDGDMEPKGERLWCPRCCDYLTPMVAKKVTDDRHPTCGKACPEHGTACPVVEWSEFPEDAAIARKVFGSNVVADEHTTHLCLHDPKNPHTWTEEAK